MSLFKVVPQKLNLCDAFYLQQHLYFFEAMRFILMSYSIGSNFQSKYDQLGSKNTLGKFQNVNYLDHLT